MVNALAKVAYIKNNLIKDGFTPIFLPHQELTPNIFLSKKSLKKFTILQQF